MRFGNRKKGRWSTEGKKLVLFGETGNIIWASKSLLEDQFTSLEQATSTIYDALLMFIYDTGYHHPLRFWNYLPNINFGKGDGEAYKRFCSARYTAFEQAKIPIKCYPAASAVGHRSKKGLVVSVIASKLSGSHHPNPRQMNAFEYPRIYGKKSPSFARATSVMINGLSQLFVSGTASITGHESVCRNDLAGQLGVTHENIEYLVKAHAYPQGMQIHSLCVYLKHHEHLGFVKNWLKNKYPNISAAILQADICRSELLVEVECFCTHESQSNAMKRDY